ncbi:MAG TPA: HNH endonuclease signature motif containing protein [Acidimicrobiia bacterium]|nr:HNH endonuclease signature motif containing protein [Acidimicrobiia bacterium]
MIVGDFPVVTDAVPVDVLEGELIALERLIARARARQARLLAELDVAQVAAMDGARSMLEWTAARLDVTQDTAGRLVRAAKGLAEWDDVRVAAEAGEVSFDRAEATLALHASGAAADVVARGPGLDLAGVRRLAARHRRIRKVDEEQAFRERYVATQTSLDGTAGRFWGRLPGFEFRLFEKAIDQRADMFRDLPGPAPQAGARRADALVSIAQDSLDERRAGAERSPSTDPLVTVFVHAGLAGATGGEAGAEIEFGPKVGPATLERILCGGAVKVIGLENGTPVAAGDASRAISPAVRRTVAWRDGGCTIDGCRSRYRLEPHHVRPWSEGGGHRPDNLTTLCWYHHHVVVHGEGRRLDPESPPGRRRFLRLPGRASGVGRANRPCIPAGRLSVPCPQSGCDRHAEAHGQRPQRIQVGRNEPIVEWFTLTCASSRSCLHTGPARRGRCLTFGPRYRQLCPRRRHVIATRPEGVSPPAQRTARSAKRVSRPSIPASRRRPEATDHRF